MPRIKPYIVCGVDVYRTQDCAKEDNLELNLNRPLARIIKDLESKGQDVSDKLHEGQYFTSRHYGIIDQNVAYFHTKHLKLIFSEQFSEIPCIDIKEVKSKLDELRTPEIALIFERCIISSDDNATYMLTPLTIKEISDLFRE